MHIFYSIDESIQLSTRNVMNQSWMKFSKRDKLLLFLSLTIVWKRVHKNARAWQHCIKDPCLLKHMNTVQQSVNKLSARVKIMLDVRRNGVMDSLNTSKLPPIEINLKNECGLMGGLSSAYNLNGTNQFIKPSLEKSLSRGCYWLLDTNSLSLVTKEQLSVFVFLSCFNWLKIWI